MKVAEAMPVTGEKFGVLRRPWKYIVAEEEKTVELYDLSTDPREQVTPGGGSIAG